MPRSARFAPMFGVCLVSLLAAASSHAQVYKWTDANGQTHYSERKSDADSQKAREVPLDLPAEVPPPSKPAAPQAAQKAKPAPTAKAPAPAKPERLSDRTQAPQTPAARCALARDVLSGAVKRSSFRPIDDHDREVARNEVQATCPSR